MSSNYKKNYSALRRIINDDELEYSRNFVKFQFNRHDRNREGQYNKGIYNVLTNNVIAMVNPKGNVFFRASSIYAPHIKESKNKVILDKNMRRFKNFVGSHQKMYGKMNMMAEKAAERLIENDDEPNKVLLFHWNPNERLDDRWVIRRIKDIVKPKDDSNTGYALNNLSLIGEEDKQHDRYKAYLQIEDFSEKIRIKQREDKAKKAVINSLLSNLADIVQSSIMARGTLNPLQFTYRDEEGEMTGYLNMRDMYLDIPSDINIREYYSERQLLGLVRFGDRLGSLVEQGVDEQELRMEQERRQQERNEQMMRDAQRYAELAYAPGSIYRYDGSANIRVPHFNEVTWVTREQVEAMAMPDVSGWDVPQISQEYPSNEREARALVDPVVAPPLTADDITATLDIIDNNSTMSSA